jgi:hypothetical protein
MQYAEQHLSHRGVLKNTSGFVYVDVEDDYIHKLLPFLTKEGFEEPPYFGQTDLVGAHISVIYPREVENYHIEEIEECGEEIFFELRECQLAHPPNWKTIDQVYFITVEAPRLDQIREKYGLPKREHNFHITVGVKPLLNK